MQHAPPGKIYLAKQIDGRRSPYGNANLEVTSDGARYQLNTVYDDTPDGEKQAEDTKRHLEGKIHGTVFVILKALKTPQGNHYVPVSEQQKPRPVTPAVIRK